ncbi:MAG: SHOCT domain-containing protein [Candidatus Hydrogenedentes bacterium]|nr:SHOCT domain-containing protein [Candidatus Hydrogenedentota bacterium]
MYSVKPGRGPSAMSAVGGVIFIGFGVLWTILAGAMAFGASSVLNKGFGGQIGIFGLIPMIFPLFGVLFIVAGIASVVYSLRNATSPNRYSAVEITTGSEEPDPLNETFGAIQTIEENAEVKSVEERLAKLDELRGKGLVSETEYAEQRERILNDL